MVQSQADLTRVLTATSGRLRQLEADWASLPDDVRDDLIREEVGRALATVLPDQKASFLAKLRSQFPTFDLVGPSSSSPASSPAAGNAGLDDVDFLVERLRAATAHVGIAERRRVARKLADAGLAPSGGDVFPPKSVEAFFQKTHIDATAALADGLDPARTIDVLGRVVDFAASIDQIAWSTWRQIARNSKLRRSSELSKVIARYLANDADVSRADVVQELERLRQLTAAIISSVGRIGPQLSQRVLGKLSPAAIAAVVDAEKGGMLSNRDARCWRKFVELMETLDEASVEREVLGAVADYIESLIRGLT